MSSDNPFVPPKFAEANPASHQDSFQYNYMNNFLFLFASPNWMMNWLCVTLILFIPILGPILLIGYQYEILGHLIYHRAQRYPDFDFGKFGNYLGRGIWPFLVALVVGICAMPLFFVIMLLPVAAVAALGDQANDVLWIASTLMMYGVLFVMGMLMNLVLIPFQLRAGLAQDFGSAFNLSFAKDFLGKIWIELLLGLLFIAVLSPFLAFAGVLVFCIGYLFALSLLTLSFGYHIYQIYRLYLLRGGELVPYKPSV